MQKKEKFHVYIRDPDSRLIHRTFTRKRDAEEFRAQFKIQKERTKAGLRSPSKKAFPLGDYVHHWLRELVKKRPISTVDDYARKLRLHVLPYLKDRPIASIDRKEYSLLLDHIQTEHGLENATRNRVRAILHKLYNDAIQEELCEVNPISHIEVKRENPAAVHVLWTPEECQTYLDGARKKDPVFYAFAQGWLNTGARKSELIPLLWSDIDWEKGILTIARIFEQATGEVVPRTKSDGLRRELRPKYVGINETFYSVLEEHRRAAGGEDASGLVFHRDGEMLDPRKLTKIHTQLCQGLGLRHCRIHDLRHVMASMLRKVADIYEVKEQLGHSSITTTERYVHSRREEARDRVKAFNPFQHRKLKGVSVTVSAECQEHPKSGVLGLTHSYGSRGKK